MTKAEFVQEANAICQEADAERSEALRDAGGNPALAKLAAAALAPVQGMTEELAALNPPPSEVQATREMIDAFEAGVAEVEADPADPSVAIAAFAEASELAEESGLTDCTI